MTGNDTLTRALNHEAGPLPMDVAMLDAVKDFNGSPCCSSRP